MSKLLKTVFREANHLATRADSKYHLHSIYCVDQCAVSCVDHSVVKFTRQAFKTVGAYDMNVKESSGSVNAFTTYMSGNDHSSSNTFKVRGHNAINAAYSSQIYNNTTTTNNNNNNG